MKKIAREFADIYRFFWKTPIGERSVVFYAEHEGYFAYFEGLIRELTELRGLTIAYITSDVKDPIFSMEAAKKGKIFPFYIRTLLPYFMLFVHSKVFVMTMTDLGHFHIKRSINQVHYVYLFHALVSTHMAYRESAFDSYDTILCAGPHQVAEIRQREKLKQLPPKNLMEAGYYRLERIYNSYKNFKHKRRDDKKVILIAPSWGKDNVLEACGGYLIDKLLNAGYEVIVRPHPETIRRFPKLVDSFAVRFGNNDFFTLERSVASDDSILRADVLISDTSGITLEYSFGTERPVLFIDVPPKVRNENFRELEIKPIELALRDKIGIIVSPKKLDDIDQMIDNLISKKDDYQESIRVLRAQYVYAFGQSSKISSKYITDLITQNVQKA